MPTDPSTEATAPALTPRHGNGVLHPWQPGQSGNPGGRPPAVREALRLAKDAAPDAMRLLIHMMNDPAEDSRARIVAATHILDRAMGKPKDAPPAEKDGEGPGDVNMPEVRARIRERIDAIRATLDTMDSAGADKAEQLTGGTLIILPPNGR